MASAISTHPTFINDIKSTDAAKTIGVKNVFIDLLPFLRMPYDYYAYVSFLNLPFLLRDNYLRKGLSNPFGEIILSTHLRRLVREEVTGLERIQDLGNLELLALRLPSLWALHFPSTPYVKTCS